MLKSSRSSAASSAATATVTKAALASSARRAASTRRGWLRRTPAIEANAANAEQAKAVRIAAAPAVARRFTARRLARSGGGRRPRQELVLVLDDHRRGPQQPRSLRGALDHYEGARAEEARHRPCRVGDRHALAVLALDLEARRTSTLLDDAALDDSPTHAPAVARGVDLLRELLRRDVVRQGVARRRDRQHSHQERDAEQ